MKSECKVRVDEDKVETEGILTQLTQGIVSLSFQVF